ncbi:MAG: two-component regulator propeller domain-containing protein, partial [Gammaproteobacteria bacterium]
MSPDFANTGIGVLMRGEKLTEIPAARLVNACRTLAYLALLALMPIDGQATHRVGPNTRFNHLTIEDGLLQNSAIDILQDKTGFIWIATEAGLHRYDGYGFTVFRNDSTDAGSLQDNHINVLFEDSHSNVWVGTYAGGLHRFNPATQDFDSFRHDPSNPDSLSNDYVRAVAEDEAGYLWVATFSGLDVLDPNTGSVEHVRVEDETGSLQSEFSPWSIYVDADSRIWVGTVDGLFVYDEKTSTIHPAGNTPQQAKILAKNSASAIVEDFDGTLWIGMYGMLVHLDTERNVSRVY